MARKNSAFTLIEIMLALTVMGLATVTIIGLESSILAATHRSDQKTTAISIARVALSHLESNPPSTPTTFEGTANEIAEKISGVPFPFNLDLPEYLVNVEVREVTEGVIPPKTLMLANVRVSWSELPADSITVPWYYVHPSL